MTDNNTVPIDATAEQSAAIVRSAIAWRSRVGQDPLLNREEWALYSAVLAYGDIYKGVFSR